MPVAELGDRVTMAELQHWSVWYQMEADAMTPADRRPIRARTPQEACAALDSALRTVRKGKRG
jgi:hypothetical protein